MEISRGPSRQPRSKRPLHPSAGPPETTHCAIRNRHILSSLPPPPTAAPARGAGGCRGEKEETKTKASSVFKAAASLGRGPGWRCKPAGLIETKLQVQREVIRKPPSGSMLPFKFHLIKPKEKKPLSLLPPFPEPLLPTEQRETAGPLPDPLPPFLSPLPGREEHPHPHPRPFPCVFRRPRWPGLSFLRQQIPHPVPAQKTTQTPMAAGDPFTDG